MGSGGITIGTITKMISERIEHEGREPIAPSTIAVTARIAAGSAWTQSATSRSVPSMRSTSGERGRGDQQREQRTGRRHRLGQHLAQRGPPGVRDDARR